MFATPENSWEKKTIRDWKMEIELCTRYPRTRRVNGINIAIFADRDDDRP